jgi:hypothetical protein
MVLVPEDLKARFEAAHPRYWLGDASTVAANAEAFVNSAIAQKRVDIGSPVSVFVLDSPIGRWLKPALCGR